MLNNTNKTLQNKANQPFRSIIYVVSLSINNKEREGSYVIYGY